MSLGLGVKEVNDKYFKLVKTRIDVSTLGIVGYYYL